MWKYTDVRKGSKQIYKREHIHCETILNKIIIRFAGIVLILRFRLKSKTKLLYNVY